MLWAVLLREETSKCLALKIPKVLLRNKLFRKGKSEEHIRFISHSITESTL